jgi:hypothetical protein
VQEVALAREAKCLCGTLIMPFKHLENAPLILIVLNWQLDIELLPSMIESAGIGDGNINREEESVNGPSTQE